MSNKEFKIHRIVFNKFNLHIRMTGKNKHIILLVESATKIDTGILGKDLEYITYPENEIEKTFCSLLQEFRSIGVKGIFF